MSAECLNAAGALLRVCRSRDVRSRRLALWTPFLHPGRPVQLGPLRACNAARFRYHESILSPYFAAVGGSRASDLHLLQAANILLSRIRSPWLDLSLAFLHPRWTDSRSTESSARCRPEAERPRPGSVRGGRPASVPAGNSRLRPPTPARRRDQGIGYASRQIHLMFTSHESARAGAARSGSPSGALRADD